MHVSFFSPAHVINSNPNTPSVYIYIDHLKHPKGETFPWLLCLTDEASFFLAPNVGPTRFYASCCTPSIITCLNVLSPSKRIGWNIWWTNVHYTMLSSYIYRLQFGEFLGLKQQRKNENLIRILNETGLQIKVMNPVIKWLVGFLVVLFQTKLRDLEWHFKKVVVFLRGILFWATKG